ncbi:MAG: ATP-binding cassette domain-containing protein [Peptococcaceae bacterium]|nr:ATP-binding cassette domain-containing protein [Peptococcaceae bacterium]
MEFILEARDIILKKGSREILNVGRFALKEGETIAIVGPNGSGKSTLLQVMALLQQPAKGVVLFRGDPVNRKNVLAFRRRMAVVFQESLLLKATVFENVAMGLRLRGCSGNEIAPRVNLWLDRLGVSHLAQRMPGFLSGGEAQRVSIARAMALNPEVLFLDEPFTSLDYPTRISLLKEMGGILKESKTTTLFVTHDYTEIPYLTGDAVVLEDGRIRHRGRASELFRDGFENIFNKSNGGNGLAWS